ncbi:HotDog domain-containing protein [Sphaerosporella brunnea]|uniref:HotDog domain-containing protein n=1 Tax=Sphaerosporella brunnea TaxID=1250544 RepID=A0A5J5FCI4_9PEZI|nr:HotDog domain-containing protein [Sphaerosporella brunnea]
MAMETSNILRKPLIRANTISHHADFTTLPWASAILNAPTSYLRTDWARSSNHRNSDSLFSRTFKNSDALRAYTTITSIFPGGEKEFLCLVSLGEDLCGHHDILHGGMVLTLLDEVCGAAVEAASFTAYLNATFKKPVRTPGVVLCRSRVVKKERRKVFVNGTVENGMGTVLASAEGLFVRVVTEAKL